MPISDAIPEEPTVKAAVDGMIADIESVYGPLFSAKIADVTSYFEEVADSLMHGGNHDTPIGNLVTDAFRATTGTQIAMEVGGSTAEPLYPGPIVAADAFRVVGYGFNTVNGLGYRLVTFKLAGVGLYAGLEFGLSGIEQDDEFLVQVSGMKYSYDPERDPFTRVVAAEVGGAPLDPQAMYTVTANEFVPLFLDMMGIPYEDLHVCGDTTEFSALAGYIQQLGSVTPKVEGRVSIPLVSVPSDRHREAIPKTYELHQNYPNPFNPLTVIKYTVGGTGDEGRVAGLALRAETLGQEDRSGQWEVANVSLVVYDLLGREVARLVNERKAPGSYEVGFDAGGLASGVYLYRLVAGSFSAVKKMMLVK
jgi:hypothetical protein